MFFSMFCHIIPLFFFLFVTFFYHRTTHVYLSRKVDTKNVFPLLPFSKVDMSHYFSQKPFSKVDTGDILSVSFPTKNVAVKAGPPAMLPPSGYTCSHPSTFSGHSAEDALAALRFCTNFGSVVSSRFANVSFLYSSPAINL